MAGPTGHGESLGAALNDLLRAQVTPATGCRPTTPSTGTPSSPSSPEPTAVTRHWTKPGST